MDSKHKMEMSNQDRDDLIDILQHYDVALIAMASPTEYDIEADDIIEKLRPRVSRQEVRRVVQEVYFQKLGTDKNNKRLLKMIFPIFLWNNDRGISFV